MYWSKKYARGVERLWLYLVLSAAGILRVILISLGWPLTNSDEATMGLMAMHITNRGELPIFFYGQNYMGALEAYFAALFFRFFGPSLFSLRLGLDILFVLFLWALYYLTNLLYSRRYALLTITLLCLGSLEMLSRQLRAVGGAVETMLFGTLSLLLASYLALTYQKEGHGKPTRIRLLLYGLLGCAMGVGIWSHMLVLPFVGCALLLLLLFCWRELQTRATLSLLFGLCIGLFPLIVFNIRYPLQNSLVTLLQLQSSGGTGVVAHNSLWYKILGTVLISVPSATGSPSICTLSTSPGAWREQVSSCMVAQGVWGVGFLLLWSLATLLTIIKLWKLRRTFGASDADTSYERKVLIIYTARLLVLASAGLTLLAYVLSPAPALVPITSTRYLVGLLVAFPAILAPLWEPLHDTLFSASIDKLLLPLRRLAFLAIGVMLVFSTLGVFQQVQGVQALNAQRQVFIDDLLHLHIHHIYSDYWTCDNMVFQSKEQIICATLDDNLQPGVDRYPLYRSIVQQDSQSAYVFQVGSAPATLFWQKVGQSGRQYSRRVVDGYVVYQPISTSASTSTGIPIGNPAMPTAERACCPASAP